MLGVDVISSTGTTVRSQRRLKVEAVCLESTGVCPLDTLPARSSEDTRRTNAQSTQFQSRDILATVAVYSKVTCGLFCFFPL